MTKIFLSLSIITLVAFSCQKETPVNTPDDDIAFYNMQLSLNKATIENNICLDKLRNNDYVGLNQHDSLFHHHVNNYNNYHNNHSHGQNNHSHGQNYCQNNYNGGMNHNCSLTTQSEMINLYNSHQSNIH